jgi:deoxyribonuclease-4
VKESDKIMLNIGCHLSVAKGYEHMGKEALSIEANTFQFFTRNPRGSKAKAVNPKDAAALMDFMKEHNFAPILGHAPYTLNACSADPKVREFAQMVMADDLKNLEYVPGNLYVFHPGSHVGQGVEVGIGYIVKQLNQILWPEQATTVLLETMSGKGSEVGSTFEEIKSILDQVEIKDKIGVCLDTCHIYSAGYDIVDNLHGVLEEFDKVIGLEHLKAIHLNDSMNPFNSRKDRHAKIGEGTIGFDTIARVINHPKLKQLPFFLETPNEVPGYAEEIKRLRQAFTG